MQALHTNQAPAAIGPYAQAIVCEGWLYSSGQIALRPDGSLCDGDVIAQTEQVFANLQAVLAAAQADLSHVVKTTVFLADMSDFSAMNGVYEARFAGHKPARSCVQAARLPRDVKVEIEVIARLPTV